MRAVAFEPRFERWRELARGLLGEGVQPHEVDWRPEGESPQLSLPARAPGPSRARGVGGLKARGASVAAAPRVPRAFLDLAQSVSLHRDAGRWALLYRTLWRLVHGEPHLVAVGLDDDVLRLRRMAQAVRRDRHKMKAFVRFRRAENDLGETWYIAWHRPDHRIFEAVAPFFVERFNDQRWMILTPDGSTCWDLKSLRFGPGVPREAAPDRDEMESLWKTYYASIFNPARVKVKAMKAEMPVRHWGTLPEAALIPQLLLEARGRVESMVKKPRRPPAMDAIPEGATLPVLSAALATCRACGLCENGTRPVAGLGPVDARTVLIGEQPGDVEERLGRPFAGPAGEVLDRALAAAGLDRSELYVTNAVKHFKYEERGGRRIHKTPNLTEVSACRPWLDRELSLIRPQIAVGLGATAARMLFGGEVRLRRDRGSPRRTRFAEWTLITYHPAALLRIPDPSARRTAEEAFFADLRLVAERARAVRDLPAAC
ncbi:MAG: UdgX family uracil-DNA binding protein [Acidobacteriota bacterium]